MSEEAVYNFISVICSFNNDESKVLSSNLLTLYFLVVISPQVVLCSVFVFFACTYLLLKAKLLCHVASMILLQLVFNNSVWLSIFSIVFIARKQ